MDGLHLIGVSTRTASAAVRERLALDDAAADTALTAAASLGPGVGALVLSTCNRTELLLSGVTDDAAADAWHRAVVRGPAGASCPAPAGSRYHLTGLRAAEHLMRVACGIESSVLGDAEIVGQLRRAADRARCAGALGPRLSRLVDHALRVAKRARATTPISAGGAGVGSAIASIVASRVPQAADVVLLGAGDAASVIARELTKRLPVALAVANRTPQRAEALVARFGGRVLDGPAAVEGALLGADVVVAATSAPKPVVTAEVVERLRRQRPAWSPLVIDAGFPRNVELVPGLDLVPLESLSEREASMRRCRESAIPAVERLITAALSAWVVVDRRPSPAAPAPAPAFPAA